MTPAEPEMLVAGVEGYWGLRIYCDPRVGGQVRYFVSEETPVEMRIPSKVRECVIFLGCRTTDSPDRPVWCCTAFLIHKPLIDGRVIQYLVTARHNIEGLARESADQKVYFRINPLAGPSSESVFDLADWRYHPDDAEADVAVMPIVLPSGEAQFRTISVEGFATNDIMTRCQISLGDEVFIAGLFTNHPGDDRAEPIMRMGNIAAMPTDRVSTDRGAMRALLIESRSIGGLSGSPVFVSVDPYLDLQPGYPLVKTGTGRPVVSFRLLGMIQGHWDEANGQGVNMGIAVVVPAATILETLEQPSLKVKHDELIEKIKRERPRSTSD